MMATCLTLLAASSIKTDCDTSALSTPGEASRPGTAAFKLSSHFILDQEQSTMRVDVDMIAEIDKADADEIRRTRARILCV